MASIRRPSSSGKRTQPLSRWGAAVGLTDIAEPPSLVGEAYAGFAAGVIEAEGVEGCS